MTRKSHLFHNERLLRCVDPETTQRAKANHFLQTISAQNLSTTYTDQSSKPSSLKRKYTIQCLLQSTSALRLLRQGMQALMAQLATAAWEAGTGKCRLIFKRQPGNAGGPNSRKGTIITELCCLGLALAPMVLLPPSADPLVRIIYCSVAKAKRAVSTAPRVLPS